MIKILTTLLFLSAFLSQSSFLEKWDAEYSKLEEFDELKLFPKDNPIFLKGDFFGDDNLDYVFYATDSEEKVKLIFINEGESRIIHILGDENDPFDMDDYRWAKIFKKVKKGEVLWSNFTDDFRKISDVPENEKVFLDYDALYLHAAESCGGGFVFWKDGKFNWLQQE